MENKIKKKNRGSNWMAADYKTQATDEDKRKKIITICVAPI